MSRYSYHQRPEDEWPSRSDLASEMDLLPPIPLSPEDRGDVVADLVALQKGADR